MVAYTSPDCLPYFEGTDSPCLNTGTLCDPSTVWCDFAEIVERRLDEFDAVVESTITSTPIAWVETTTPTVIVVGSVAHEPVFTTVRIDTDQMVNLDTNSGGFTIQTDGLYVVFAYAFGVANGVANGVSSILDVDFIPINSSYPNSFTTLFTNRTPLVVDVAQTNNIHFTVPLFAGQFIRPTLDVGGTVGDFITYSQISLGVAWMGGLP